MNHNYLPTLNKVLVSETSLSKLLKEYKNNDKSPKKLVNSFYHDCNYGYYRIKRRTASEIESRQEMKPNNHNKTFNYYNHEKDLLKNEEFLNNEYPDRNCFKTLPKIDTNQINIGLIDEHKCNTDMKFTNVNYKIKSHSQKPTKDFEEAFKSTMHRIIINEKLKYRIHPIKRKLTDIRMYKEEK